MTRLELDALSDKEFAELVMGLGKELELEEETLEEIFEEAKLFNSRAIKMYEDIQKDAEMNQEELVRASRRTGK